MRSRSKLIVVLIIFLVFSASLGIFLVFNKKDELKDESKNNNYQEKIDINQVINNIKEENASKELVYESSKIKNLLSLVYFDDNKYSGVVLNTLNGKKMAFKDLIKEDYIEEYNDKEKELLELKYPKFICDAIEENKDNKGYKFYYVKDNEVIIFYYDYEILYDMNNLNLRINYNEIKDYLNFEAILDSDYENENGYNYVGTKKSVAITFDDGPSSKYNPLILKALSDNKAHATFFMVGKMISSCNSCVLNTYKAGHIIGSHTYEHMNIRNTDMNEVINSLNKVNSLYNQITGDNIKYLRPPYGSYNSNNLNNIKLPFILWSIDTEDWRYRNKDYVVNHIKENVSDGAIILMHELYESSYQALEEILPWLYANNYQVVNIEEMAELKGKTLSSGVAYRNIR